MSIRPYLLIITDHKKCECDIIEMINQSIPPEIGQAFSHQSTINHVRDQTFDSLKK
jgi:hypothetical protein